MDLIDALKEMQLYNGWNNTRMARELKVDRSTWSNVSRRIKAPSDWFNRKACERFPEMIMYVYPLSEPSLARIAHQRASETRRGSLISKAVYWCGRLFRGT